MTASVYRYEVPVDDRPHTFGLYGDPLGVGCRDPFVVEFWAVHNDLVGRAQKRAFLVVGTGQPLPEEMIRHWGYAYGGGGHMVWHLIEIPA